MAPVQTNFAASVTEAGNLLRKMGLLLADNPYPREVEDVAARSRKMQYREHWRMLIDESAFKYLLLDYSFLTFRNDSDGASFGYYPTPFVFMSYEEFLFSIYGDEWRSERDDPSNEAAYLSELENAGSRDAALTLRFDHHPGQYAHGRHPAAHMHAGFDTEVRVGCGVILTPLAFACFVMRQVYPGDWCDSYEALKHFASASGPKSLAAVGAEHLGERDRLELYLS